VPAVTVAVSQTGNALGLSRAEAESLADDDLSSRLDAIAREFREAGADHVIRSVAELPELTPAFVDSVGFNDIDDLRKALKEMLERRHQTQQRQEVRRQLLDALLAKSPFDLPKDLVSRQEKDTVRRLAMELRREGLSDNEIRAREAQIRANAHQTTLRSLQEFFLLAKIAEANKILVEDSDLDDEIESIAERTGESIRRVRSRLEKEGMSDSLSVQILERKVLDHVLRQVEIEDVVMDVPNAHANVETLDDVASASGDVSDEEQDAAESEAETSSKTESEAAADAT